MIVPTQKGPSGLAPQQEMPSEANLLMALSEMQKQGRFKVAGDVVPFRPFGKISNDPDAVKTKILSTQTQGTLNKALGISAKVLPMTSKDKD